MSLVTTPAPTVRPLSRMAKRRPTSMATAKLRSTVARKLSPGITIAVPSGRVTLPEWGRGEGGEEVVSEGHAACRGEGGGGGKEEVAEDHAACRGEGGGGGGGCG